MTHQNYCDCPDCMRLWGTPRERLLRFLRRLDRGEFRHGRVEQVVIEEEGKTIVMCGEASDAREDEEQV